MAGFRPHRDPFLRSPLPSALDAEFGMDPSPLVLFKPHVTAQALSRQSSSQKEQDQQQTAVLIEVQLPIQNNNIGAITRALDTAIENAGKATVENQRPWLLIRFLPLTENNRIRSDFGACNTLESYLSSPSLTRRCRPVAILDGKYADHVILPVLSCRFNCPHFAS